VIGPRRLLAAAAALLAWAGLAQGGHEVPIYPSYYPHEITLTAMTPEQAAPLLADARVQAYVGPEPHFPGALPPSVRAVEALGDFIIVWANP